MKLSGTKHMNLKDIPTRDGTSVQDDSNDLSNLSSGKRLKFARVFLWNQFENQTL
jgi:hypothetical protein